MKKKLYKFRPDRKDVPRCAVFECLYTDEQGSLIRRIDGTSSLRTPQWMSTKDVSWWYEDYEEPVLHKRCVLVTRDRSSGEIKFSLWNSEESGRAYYISSQVLEVIPITYEEK